MYVQRGYYRLVSLMFMEKKALWTVATITHKEFITRDSAALDSAFKMIREKVDAHPGLPLDKK
jgi:hypothetical protein